MSKLKATAKQHKAQFNNRILDPYKGVEVYTPAKLADLRIMTFDNTECGWLVYEALTVFKDGKYVPRTKKDGKQVFGYTVYLPATIEGGKQILVKDNNYDTTSLFASTISLDDENVVEKEAVRQGEEQFCIVTLQDTFENLCVLTEDRKTVDGRHYTTFRIDSEE